MIKEHKMTRLNDKGWSLGLCLALVSLMACACTDEGKATTEGEAGQAGGVSAGADSAGATAGAEAGLMAGELVAGGAGSEPGGVDVMTDPCAAPAEPACDGQFDPPPPINEHGAAYADGHQMLVIFGGNTAVPENCGFPAYTGEGTTWLFYDHALAPDCGPWVKIESGNPPGRARHSMTWGEDKVWMFGGRVRAGSSGPYQLFNDLWRFDPNTRVWEEVSVSGARPEPRYNSSLTYDPVRRALWVFAGNIASNALNPDSVKDLWRFDIESATWTKMPDHPGVKERMWHSALFDPVRDRLVFFGGGDETAFFDNAQYFNDFLYYWPAEERWDQDRFLNGEPAPQGRFWSQISYMPSSDSYLLFGGHDDAELGNRNDTWIYAPDSETWTQRGGEDTFNRPANGFCDFPADFTIVDRSAPERRNAHTLNWSATCERGLLFGGKTDCGATNDVWRYEGEEWVSLELATEGEACHRWRSNPDNCVNMCF